MLDNVAMPFMFEFHRVHVPCRKCKGIGIVSVVLDELRVIGIRSKDSFIVFFIFLVDIIIIYMFKNALDLLYNII